MKTRNHRRMRLAAAAAAALLLAGCTPAGGDSKPSDTIVLAAQGDVPPLDPHRLTGTVGLRVSDAIYDTLVREDLTEVTQEAPEIQPALAEDWEVSEDGLKYEFTIREGVTFHDGTTFDANAVQVNFDRILDPDSPVFSDTAASNMQFLTRWIKSVEVTDDETFAIELSSSFPEFLSLLNDRRMAIVSPNLLESGDDDAIATTPIGTGPYSTDGIDQGSDITLKRNEDYWRGTPDTAQLLFTSVSDPNTMVSALQTGQVDVILSAGAAQVEQLEGEETVTLQYPEPANSYFIRLNTLAPGVDDQLVRQALNYAIDRDGISAVTNGQATPLTGSVPVGNHAWEEGVNSRYSYDPGRARDLLEEAGVADGMPITLLSPSEGPGFAQAREVMSLVQENFADVGVDLEIQFMEFTAMVAEESGGYEDDVAGSFNGWTTGSDLSYWFENMFSPDLIPPSGVNRGWYENGKLRDVFSEARAEHDEAARNEVYRQAAEIIDEDAPWVFLYQDRLPRAFTVAVSGPVEAPSVYFDYATLQKSE